MLKIRKNENQFHFSCLPYTASEIENAAHQEELLRTRRTVLCIYNIKREVKLYGG